HAAAGNPGPRECPAPTPLDSYQNPVLIPSVNTASEAGWTTSRTPIHHRPPPISIRSTDLPNYLLQIDSPCATPPPQYSSRSSSPKLSSASSSRSGSDGGGVDASSFNGGPVPQYSITIYSNPRSLVHTCDVRGQSVEIHVPDIVLSPVPWLPSSDAYPMSSADRARQSSVHCAPMARGGQRTVPGCVSSGLGSPPGYLEVPSRKSRSRRHAEKEKAKERGLVMMRPAPAVPRVAAAAAARERDPPSENEYRRDHASWSKELEKKQRRMFTTPAASAPLTFPIGESVKPPPVPPKSPARTTTTIITGSASMQRCHSLPLAASTSRDAKMRESGLLLRSRSSPSISPPPPPQPVLPLDLEPVYPPEHPSALGESEGRGVTSPVSYADEKGHVDEKKGMVAMDRESEEEDMPLSKSLLLAMRKKTEELKGLKAGGGGMRPAAGSNMSNSGEEKRLSSSLVTNMVKMQIFGRLGALSVRAKLAIERELDSDGDEEEDEEEGDGEGATRWEIADQKEKRVMANVSHAQFLSRENAFVIGDEEEHPPEPTCTYDPIEGLVLAPDTVEDPNERSKLVAAQAESHGPSSSDPPSASDPHHQHYQQQQQQQQQQYHQASSSSRPFSSTSPPSATAHPPSSSGAGLSPNGLSSSSLYTHPPQDPLHMGYAAGPSRMVPGPTLPPLNAFPAKGTHGSGTMGAESGYVDNNNNNNPGGYYATGLHSDVRSTSYPTVSDEAPNDRTTTHGRSSSHPYYRDQPHISTLAKAERANSQQHHASIAHPHVRSDSGITDDPFAGVNDVSVSVSKLGRQTDHRSRGYSITNHPSPPYYDLMFSGWSRDLPPRHEMANYIELFFRFDPCSARMLHRPTLLNNLNYPPTHPDFPHPALLHAICATASRYTFRGRLDASLNASLSAQQQLQPPPRDKFAEFHANKTRVHHPLVVVLFRGTVGGGVDPGGLSDEGGGPAWIELFGVDQARAGWTGGEESVFGPAEESFGNGDEKEGVVDDVDERDIGTELPLTYAHYEAMLDMPSNPQTLHSESVYTKHPVAYTDSYILFLKSIMLFGRITDYSVRMGIRAPLLGHGQGQGSQQQAHDGQSPLNPHHLSPNATTTSFNMSGNSPTPGGAAASPSPGTAGGPSSSSTTDPRNAPGFQTLDRLVSSDFLNSFPPPFRSCLGGAAPGAGLEGLAMGFEHGFVTAHQGAIDTDLYVAHLVPHAATITLHSPWVNYADPTRCPSVARCMEAARAILDKYYLLTSTSFDITLLHPFVTICWYLAAVVQIHLCKRLIETGDLMGEATCWGEINMLRNALVTYGNCSPIGTRQEKLLHPMMKEIIDMTTQSQPLLVGLPLYPFSLDSAFGRAEKQAAAGGSGPGSVTHSGHVSGIGALLNAPSEEVDVDEAVAPIPDISFGDDADTVMSGMDTHSAAGQQHAASIAVPSVHSLGTGWTMMTDGK
ncbi:hypothetical protein FRC17_000537, partial [Serendipita sp. 399]